MSLKEFLKIRIFLLFLGYFLINIYLIFNLSYYSDDWTFFNRNGLSFLEHSYEHSYKIQYGVDRHASIIFFYIFNIFEDVKIQHIINLTFNFFNFFLIFYLFKKAIINITGQNNIKHINEILLILIIIYFLFPFNIGGQYWLTSVHARVSLSFLLLSIYFLNNKKLTISIIFLAFCFSAYEIFFLTYIFILYIFYFCRLFDKKDFKIYIFVSIVIQILFIYLKKRDSHNFDIITFLELFQFNFIKLFGSIYISMVSHINLTIQIILFIPIVIYIINLLKNISSMEKKKFILIIFLILLSFPANNILMSLGDYGYYGKGIFSRTMFFISFGILLFLCFMIFSDSISKFTYFIVYYMLLISTVFFIFEINLWKASSTIQSKIINDKLISLKTEEIGKDLILFKGPCYNSGIEIFNSFDLNRAMRENYDEIIKKDAFFFPIQNWEGKIIDNGKRIKYHGYILDLYQYDNLILWDYFNNTFRVIAQKKDYTKNYPNLKFKLKDCKINDFIFSKFLKKII